MTARMAISHMAVGKKREKANLNPREEEQLSRRPQHGSGKKSHNLASAAVKPRDISPLSRGPPRT